MKRDTIRALQWILAAGIGATAATLLKKNPRGHRRPRVEQFLSTHSGTMVGVYTDLLHSAHLLLAKALEERKEEVWRAKDNHASHYAVTVIPTIVTALDAWLNETIGFWRATSETSEETIARLIDERLDDKFRGVAKEISGASIKVSPDLKLLLKVRHEIIHFLPYIQDISSAKLYPTWFRELKNKRLVITTGDPASEFHFSQMLGSYALGYWACQAVHDAVRILAATIPKAAFIARSAELAVDNFSFYLLVTAPAELNQFDERFDLNLTR